MSQFAMRVEGLGKRYRLGGGGRGYRTLRESLTNTVSGALRRVGRVSPQDDRVMWALRDVSFDVRPGEVLGFIGRNGAGKSTLLKILSRITEPTEGRAEVYGRVGSLLEVGTGFHPELTGRENVYLNGAILGMKRAEIDRKFDDIVAFSAVEAFIDTPVKRFSSGMQVRLAFAVAAHLDLEILVVDEVLSVGDAEFQRRCLNRMRQVTREGRTVLLVSHDMTTIRALCARALLIDRGRIVLDGEPNRVVDHYLNKDRSSSEAVGVEELERRMTGVINRTEPTIRCTEIAVLDGSRSPRASFGSDEEVLLRVTYRCLQPVTDLRVIVSVIDEDGNALLVSQSIDDPEASRLARLAPGVYRSTCTFPARLFGERTVHLTVAFENVRIEHLNFERIVSFDVHFVPYNDVVHGTMAEVRFRPRLGWNTEQLPPPEARDERWSVAR